MKLANILNEVNRHDWETFNKWTMLQYPVATPRYDKDGNAMVNITLKTKPGAPFQYEYKKMAANLDDYIQDRRLRLPIQIKRTIYDKFYK